MDNAKIKNNKLFIPYIVSLAGVLILIIAIFLPCITAVGRTAAYIETFPNAVVLEEKNMTAEDLANVPFISISNLLQSIWGEDDALVSNIFLIVFGSFAILTTVFIFFKKPIVVIIFDLLTCGTFVLFTTLLKEDIIGDDKYVWSVGYFAILIALTIIFTSSIFMLVAKIKQQRNIEEKTDSLSEISQ